MTSRARRRGWARLAALAAVALAVTSLRCGIRDDELMCEEAASHLETCCAGFVPTAHDCSRWTACGKTHEPDLDLDTSSCIIGKSCDELASSGVCTTVTRVRTSGSLSGVCR